MKWRNGSLNSTGRTIVLHRAKRTANKVRESVVKIVVVMEIFINSEASNGHLVLLWRYNGDV
jgi:hypothetical protein